MFPFVAGNQVLASEANTIASGNLEQFVAGETISGATLPVPVYLKLADTRVYACDGNVVANLRFIGFAITTATAGNNIIIQTSGVVHGFSGLTVNALYYLSDTVGTISTTKGTEPILIGKGVSTTQLLILLQEVNDAPKILQTTLAINTASATLNVAHGLGRIPKFVKTFAAVKQGYEGNIFSVGYSDGTNNKATYFSSVGSGGANAGVSAGATASYAIYISAARDSSGGSYDRQIGTITFDVTNVMIAFTYSASLGNSTELIYIQLEVY